MVRPIFQPRLINPPFGDPCLRVDLVGEKTTLLFDLGWVAPSELGRVYNVSHVFVSHAHVDHFIGFDSLIRALLTRERSLLLFGPAGITERVEGKLSGYTWNVIEEYPFSIEVRELDGGFVSSTRFRCDRSFQGEEGKTYGFGRILVDEKAFLVEAVELDHGIPSLAFSLTEPFHININKDRLLKLDLPFGPWLKELKSLIRENKGDDYEFSVSFDRGGITEERTFRLGDLKEEIVIITKGEKIVYVVDCGETRENEERIVELAEGADIFFCEASFLEEDRERAERSKHLTAGKAGLLARKAGVRKLEVFHFSPRYEENSEKVYREAMSAFMGE